MFQYLNWLVKNEKPANCFKLTRQGILRMYSLVLAVYRIKDENIQYKQHENQLPNIMKLYPICCIVLT